MASCCYSESDFVCREGIRRFSLLWLFRRRVDPRKRDNSARVEGARAGPEQHAPLLAYLFARSRVQVQVHSQRFVWGSEVALNKVAAASVPLPPRSIAKADLVASELKARSKGRWLRRRGGSFRTPLRILSPPSPSPSSSEKNASPSCDCETDPFPPAPTPRQLACAGQRPPSRTTAALQHTSSEFTSSTERAFLDFCRH